MSQIDHLGERHFSFYPAIVGIEHNEWTYREANWSEILVRNAKSSDEIWIPKSYVGDVSRVEEPSLIVGLKRELEYKGGMLSPFARHTLDMPARATGPASNENTRAEPVESGMSVRAALRSDGGAEGNVGKLIGIALLAGLVLMFVGVGLLRLRTTGGAVEYKGVMQVDLGLTAQSDYFDVIRKLGPPTDDRWRPNSGERQYRKLVYPKNDIVVILMGPDREGAFYIGAKDSRWQTVHAVVLPGGKTNTEAILRTLPKF